MASTSTILPNCAMVVEEEEEVQRAGINRTIAVSQSKYLDFYGFVKSWPLYSIDVKPPKKVFNSHMCYAQWCHKGEKSDLFIDIEPTPSEGVQYRSAINQHVIVITRQANYWLYEMMNHVTKACISVLYKNIKHKESMCPDAAPEFLNKDGWKLCYEKTKPLYAFRQQQEYKLSQDTLITDLDDQSSTPFNEWQSAAVLPSKGLYKLRIQFTGLCIGNFGNYSIVPSFKVDEIMFKRQADIVVPNSKHVSELEAF